jgi:hypothetical protein
MKGQEQGAYPWLPGLGFVFVKPGKTRCKQGGLGFVSETWRVQVSFMKPGKLEQEHCFSGGGHCFASMETLLALYNFLLCTLYKPDAKTKKNCQLVISLLVLCISVLSVYSFPEPFRVKNSVIWQQTVSPMCSKL